MIMSFISQRKTQANNRELLWLRMFEFFISYVTKVVLHVIMFIGGPRSYKADVMLAITCIYC